MANDESGRDGRGRFAGCVMLITGAASGIGRATAQRAAQEGAHIAAVDVDDARLDSLAAEIGACGGRFGGRVADVGDETAIAAAVGELAHELGPFDAVFANAGTLTNSSSLAEVDLAEWNRVLSVDLTGVMLTFRAALDHVAPEGGAFLACGSSLAIRPGVGLLPYVVAKAGVHAMARSLALELAPRHIRVNVIAPGLTDTPMTRSVDGHIERGLASVPTGRFVELADVVAMALHLLSDDARSITGSVISVDAGRTAV